MPHIALAILGGIALFLFSGFSLCFLVRPSQYIRWSQNPWMEDTPWERLQLRTVGLVFSLLILMMVSGIRGDGTKADVLEGFHQNVLIALWLAFVAAVVGGIISSVLWRFMAFRLFIRSHFDGEKLESPAWERRMTILFCSLLASIVAIAFGLAVRGYHG
jgi:hypothetical protein